MLAALRASRQVDVVGVVRSTRIEAWRRYRASGLAYTLYLGALMRRRLDARGLPVLKTSQVNGIEARAFLDRLAPDLLVCAFFNQKIAAALPGINIHPSLLPAFKGVDPVFHARLAGVGAMGVTVHRLSPQFDGGDVVSQRGIEWDRKESVLGLTERLYLEGARLFLASLENIRAGKAAPQPAPGNYDSWPTRAQVAALRAKGVRLFRWRDLF